MNIELFKGSNRFNIAEICPCGKSNHDGKFVPFIIDGTIEVKYGYCHSCGKTFLPLDKINCKNIFTKNISSVETRYVPKTIMIDSFKEYDKNVLIAWLQKILNKEKVEKIIKKYCIGTSTNGSTLFWYLDFYRNVRNAKKIKYKPDGHRDKQITPYFIYKKDDNYGSCLFGEHLLREAALSTIIILVESEKSAVIGSMYYPNYIWIATGGANSLTISKAKVLEKRNILYLPDCDDAGRNSIDKILEILKSINCKVNYYDLSPDLSNGEDIVDLILKK